MPDPPPTQPLHLVADLHITMVGTRGEDVEMHLHGGPDALVLDLDRPEALAGQLPDRRRRRELLASLRRFMPDTVVHVRSQGKRLARLRLNSRGALRIRPTLAGMRAATRIMRSRSHS